MLSVILYGRNDSHGYNLHKRAALSLNAIAAVLTHPDDEIIFVDYNSPDELPTFPEAIGDTLTDECRRRLRVIRVRPTYHAQFAARTRLAALESQSRNIATRRANPANKWILSTNTDMIFCPGEAAGSLSDIVASLADGFYHLPRFEVPEGFWERLSRSEPQAAIDAMRAEGKRFHLNEIVYGIPDNLFEAPGDFQLFRRTDLETIGGFDERMLLGWHADSNIARRMRLLRGEVLSLFPRLAGYHCGHTRQATALHGGSRTQNDTDTFVTSISDPVAAHQIDTWGAPDMTFEEVRLDGADQYLSAMTAAVPREGPDVLEATYNETSLGQVDVDPDHVLPHLGDLLFNLPAGQRIFYFGPDAALLRGVRAFLEAAERAPQFLLTDLANCPRPEALDGAWSEAWRPLRQAIIEADLFILQYPSASQTPEADRQQAQWWCQRVFSLIAEAERHRPTAERRRVVVVNAIHTGITNMAESVLAPTATPFSSRLRQGFVLDDAAQARFEREEAPVYARLGRRQAFSPQDRTLLLRIFASFAAGAPVSGWERLAPEVGAICASPTLAERQFGLPAAEAQRWLAAARSAMRAALRRPVEVPRPVDARPSVANRLCSGADWEDPAWARLAVEYFGPAALDLAERKRWVWERASLAHILQQHLPPTLPGEGASPRILLLARYPEFLAAVLTHMGYSVEYAAIDDFLASRPSGDWTPSLDLTSLLLPRPLTAYDPQTPGSPFDAVVFTLPSLFEVTAPETDALLAAVDPLMAPGARLFASATAQMNEIPYEGGLSYAEWKALYAPHGPLGQRGFEPVGGVDDTTPLDTVIRFAFQDDSQDSTPGLSYGFLKGFNTSATLCARWPETLRAGPEKKLEWTSEARPDPEAVPLPYLGEAGAGHGPAVPVDFAPGGAAQTAVWLTEHPLEAVGLAAFKTGPTLPFGGLPVNALPFVAPLGVAVVTPTATRLATPGGASFTLTLDAGEALAVSLQLDLGEVVEPSQIVVLRPNAQPVAHSLQAGRLDIRGEAPLERITVAVRLSEPQAELRSLVLTAA